MMGGKGEPCVPDYHLQKIQASDPERFCPRVELLPENQTAARLALAAAKVGPGEPIFRLFFDVETGDLSADERRGVLSDVLIALGDEGIVGRIEAAREAALARARAEAGQ